MIFGPALTGCVFEIVFTVFVMVFSVATDSILTASEATSATDGGILEGPDEKGVGAEDVVVAGLNTNPALLKISALTERVVTQTTYNGFLTCCQCKQLVFFKCHSWTMHLHIKSLRLLLIC